MTKQSIIDRAQAYCDDYRYRFTPQRRQVLEVLHSMKTSMGAYEIIEALSDDKSMVKPPTVYRAIDFWVKHGFVHKVESKNAYLLCSHHCAHQHCLVMICHDCSSVKEVALSAFPDSFECLMSQNQFKLTKSILEISGLCERCS